LYILAVLELSDSSGFPNPLKDSGKINWVVKHANASKMPSHISRKGRWAVRGKIKP
jgi:hypothetical protein